MNFEQPLPLPHEDSSEKNPSGPLLQWADLGPPVPPASCPPPPTGLASSPPPLANWETHAPFEAEWNQALEALDWTWDWAQLENRWMQLMRLDLEYFPGRLVPEVCDALANTHTLPVTILELLLWYIHLPHHRYHHGFHAALGHLLSGERRLPPEKHQLVFIARQRLANQLVNGEILPPLPSSLFNPPPPPGRSILHIEPENDD